MIFANAANLIDFHIAFKFKFSLFRVLSSNNFGGTSSSSISAKRKLSEIDFSNVEYEVLVKPKCECCCITEYSNMYDAKQVLSCTLLKNFNPHAVNSLKAKK